MFRVASFLLVLSAALPVWAAEVADATGRIVVISDRIDHVLPAGPPAAVLLAAIAPDESLGFTAPLSDAAKGTLPTELATRPPVPRLTGGQDISSLHPDLIVDYGMVSSRYIALSRDTQARTGIPTLLFDGSLDQIPTVARTLGRILNRRDRGETVARMAEAILAMPVPEGGHLRVYYARGPDGLLAAAPGTDVTAVFARLGWTVMAPGESGTFRQATLENVAALNPDVIILADPAARTVLASPAWAGLRAVREHHAIVAPSAPFGWIEEPPSINRLLGLAWLEGHDAETLAATFNAAVYGRALTTAQLAAIAGDAMTFRAPHYEIKP